MATIVPSIACLGVIGRNNNPLHLTILPSYNPSSASAITSDPEKQQQPATTISASTTASSAATGASPLRTPLQFSLLLSSTLDIFELRARAHAASGTGALSGDLGLLCAVDERLACYGYETNTGVRFVAVVDMRGRLLDPTLPSTTLIHGAIPETDRSSGGGAGNTGAAGGGAGTGTGTTGDDTSGLVNLPSLPPLSGIGILSPTSSSTTVTTSSSFIPGTSSRKPSLVASIASASTGLRDAELKPLFKAMQTSWVRLLQNPFFDLDEHVLPGGRGGRKITSKKFGEDMRRLGMGWIPGVGGFEGF
ncbi:Sedlin [Zalerion maritima]|uniref:Sedlin n=1 Tax=Zalerion maritima TaxID=339359 RepID=A0AAD5S428_9PEZI|nr:Sedlin [Zalerion maritima]